MKISVSYSAPSSVGSVFQYATAASHSLALRRVLAALQVGEGGLVRRDHAGLGAPLDGHVADGHPALHGELADGLAAVLHDVAVAAAGAGLGDQREDQVLGGDARAAARR